MNNSWIDILPPPPPVIIISWWLWLSFAVFVGVMIIAFYRWQHSAKQSALRELSLIRASLNNSKDTGDIPLRIRHAVKLGLNTNNINHISFDKKTNFHQWVEFKQQLALLCFSKNNPDRNALEKLLSDSQFWIKNYKPGHE